MSIEYPFGIIPSVADKFGRMGLAPDCREANDELGAVNTLDMVKVLWQAGFLFVDVGVFFCRGPLRTGGFAFGFILKQKGTLKENNPMCHNNTNGFHQGETPICRTCFEEGPPFCFEEDFFLWAQRDTKGKPQCIFWGCAKKGTQALALPHGCLRSD